MGVAQSPIGARRRRRPVLRGLLAAYVLLLAISHWVTWRDGASGEPGRGLSGATLREVVDGRRGERAVHVAYRSYSPSAGSPAETFVLLHGSPGSHADFASFAPVLARRFRIVAPDLPGFGGSESKLADYSIRAHADYVLQLLDLLEVERAHVVGFSMGGGVGIELYDLAPRRVASLTLLSAIGVQELELFGDHRLNHGLHAFQLWAIRAMRALVPHMGLWNRSMLTVAYARNFYDTDQRPLRGILSRFEPPALILHGRSDFLVPVEAALEHRRIVPQSDLELFDGSHFLLFSRGAELAGRVDRFLDDVGASRAPWRAQAAPDRVAAARLAFDPSSIPALTGIGLIVMLALIVLATFVSEDLACIGAGLLVSQGRIEFVPAVLVCFVGIYLGDMGLYVLGRLVGPGALARAPLRWVLGPERVEASSVWFERRGPAVVVLSRFIPGTRLPTYFAAGVLRTGFWRFNAYFVLAVAAWTPLLVGGAVLLGERVFAWVASFERRVVPAVLITGAGIFVVFKVVLPVFSMRGRRRLAGFWRRWTRWEFWPPWLFYPPVLAWIAILGLRYRSPLLFTATNPGIPASGFVGESKWEILRALSGAGERIARTGLLPAGEPLERRIERVAEFLGTHAIGLPVVLKPDAGQRGSGVAIVRSERRLADYLAGADYDLIVQEYVPGREFGVFYYRYPDQARGRILSITEKRMPFVVGDGRHTLEELILRDRRAVCLADHYLRVQGVRSASVPAVGERVRLVEIGTHCRGAVFLDGRRLRSERLRSVIDETSRTFDGFFFGRYDVRVPDEASLSEGRDLKIIELNGVTSEATHIYDPANSIVVAYRTLFEQWRIAFEIGRLNRSRGAQPTGPIELIRLLRDYRRSSRMHAVHELEVG